MSSLNKFGLGFMLWAIMLAIFNAGNFGIPERVVFIVIFIAGYVIFRWDIRHDEEKK